MSREAGPDGAEPNGEDAPPRPEWDDSYLEEVAERLQYNYDLKRDKRAQGEQFTMYGRLLIESRKQFFHQSVRYAHQSMHEHLFVTRRERVSSADLNYLVELGHGLADEWIEADEEHKSTEFTFVVVVPTFNEAVRERVHDFRDRTLLKYGYYGHYEVNLVVVAPDAEAYVASEEADVWRAFASWADTDPDSEPGLLDRLKRLFGR